MSEQTQNNDYDSEPVVYCTKCYSLKIKYDESIDSDYCAECGCLETNEIPFEEWEALYESRYGHKYTIKSNDPRKSPIFKMSLEKLKNKLYNSPFWEVIMHDLYQYVPRGISKADKILWFFDKIAKDNKVEDFKLSLINRIRNNKGKK